MLHQHSAPQYNYTHSYPIRITIIITHTYTQKTGAGEVDMEMHQARAADFGVVISNGPVRRRELCSGENIYIYHISIKPRYHYTYSVGRWCAADWLFSGCQSLGPHTYTHNRTSMIRQEASGKSEFSCCIFLEHQSTHTHTSQCVPIRTEKMHIPKMEHTMRCIEPWIALCDYWK